MDVCCASLIRVGLGWSIRVRVAVIRVKGAETGRGVGLSIDDWRSPPKLINMYHTHIVTLIDKYARMIN